MRFVFARDRGPSMRRFDVDGRLHVLNCRISKANVCPYYGREIPGHESLGLDADKVYQLYRDPAELERGASTFNNLQLMIVHVPVNAGDPMIELTVGTIGAVRYEHPYLVADAIAVWTEEAITLIETKAQAQLSSSYRYTPIMEPGVTPDGVAYDGRMCNIIGNHVALVEEGRAGPDVVVNDQLHSEVFPMKFPKLLAALKSMLKPDADMVAADAAVVKVMGDGKPASTRFLRIAAALKPFMAKDSADFSALAADAAVDAEMCAAEDAEKDDDKANDAQGENESDEDYKKRMAAKDASAPVTPGPKEGEVGKALDAALKAGKFVTAEDAKALADAARLDAITAVNALHAAREAVKPIVGVVALDSAEAVYRFALDHAKVDHKSIKEVPALAALVDATKRANSNAAPRSNVIALDSSNAARDALPGLGRFGRA